MRTLPIASSHRAVVVVERSLIDYCVNVVFQTATVLDYGEVLLSLLPVERRSAHLFKYICELSLLCSPLTVPGPARLASAILLLTRALHNYGTIVIPLIPPKNVTLNLW